MNRFIIGVFFFTLAVSVKSQTVGLPDIAADRPGMATPPFIAQPKTFQIESGFSFDRITGDHTFQETTLYNSSLLRYGINRNSEIRIQTDFLHFKTDSLNITGFNPLTLGTKLLISEAKGIIPKTSFLVNLIFPDFGNKNFRPGNFAPSFYLLMQNDITEKLNLCYNFGMEFDGESPVPVEFLALCLGYGFTEKLSGFIENYDYFTGGTKAETYLDFGCSYLLRKNFQLDLSGNMNIQNIDKYFMVNAGVSWRIRK